MDQLHRRIKAVLGQKHRCNRQNTKRYLCYLRKNVRQPCILMGRREFPWEIPFIDGGWESAAYQEMKENQPTFTDQLELVELLDLRGDQDKIVARVRRTDDQKEFELELDLLECIEFHSENYQLIDDYAIWLEHF
jgi:hypothetical protein